jgi:glycosyltransferase involved in cell wall biosynthesis
LRTLSVMLVALNEAHHLEAIRIALDQVAVPEGWRVERILVDGGSTDGTARLAQEMGFTRVLVLPGASIPVCRNAALETATGDAFAFLDADCIPCREWLEVASPYLESAEPTLVGYPVMPPGSGNWVQSAWWAHWRHKNRHDGDAAADAVETDAFRLVTTRNMLFNRPLLALAERFDEHLTTGEDTDFAFRASRKGARILAVRALRVIHLGEPATLSQFFRQQLWHANRKAYATILRSSGGKSGANAIYFSLAFLFALVLALASAVAAVACKTPWPLAGLLPLAAVALAPALWIAARAKRAALVPQLAVLYFLYGLARAIDLAGLAPRKPSWKAVYDKHGG